MAPPRRIAFLAFRGLTLLDLVGPHDALRRVPQLGVDADVQLTVIGVGTAASTSSLRAEGGMHIVVDAVYAPLEAFDLLVVPGGLAARELVHDATLVDYVRGWGRERPIASVCTGSLILGAAGHLAGIAATTHHSAFELLAAYAREVRDERVVDEGRVITAGGVCAGIDLGLHLVDRFWGTPARDKIARQMNYLGPSTAARLA
jgi:cyclohexyl-isocyanide hydratase